MTKILKPPGIVIIIIILILLILNFTFISLSINQSSKITELEADLNSVISDLNTTNNFLSNVGFIDWALNRKIISPIDLKGDYTSFVEMVDRANVYLDEAKTATIIFVNEPKPIDKDDLESMKSIIENDLDYIKSVEITTNDAAKNLYLLTDLSDTERNILLDETYFLPASVDIRLNDDSHIPDFLDYLENFESRVKLELDIEVNLEIQVPEVDLFD